MVNAHPANAKSIGDRGSQAKTSVIKPIFQNTSDQKSNAIWRLMAKATSAVTRTKNTEKQTSSVDQNGVIEREMPACQTTAAIAITAIRNGRCNGYKTG